MRATYLRLAGPLQSWAGPKIAGNVSRTEPLPTRSALEGLVAAALGLHRGERPEWFNQLTFTVRIDDSGKTINEFQTINPRPETADYQTRILALLTRKKPSAKGIVFTPDGQSKNAIVNRTYLSDAEFIVEVCAAGHEDELDRAFRSPEFVSYLGKKAFAPTFPFYLGSGETGLLEEIPVYRPELPKWKQPEDDEDEQSPDSTSPEKQAVKFEQISVMGIKHTKRQVVNVVRGRQDWLEKVAAIPALERASSRLIR